MKGLNETFVVFLFIILGIIVLTTYNSNFSSKQPIIIAEAALAYLPAPIPTFTPVEITWTGKIHWYMTYGRRLFENLTPGVEYKYFIAEPDDVIEDGGLRYSPTTMNIKDTDIVRVIGYVDDYCNGASWDFGVDDTDYRGCVPWVSIEKLEIIK